MWVLSLQNKGNNIDAGILEMHLTKIERYIRESWMHSIGEVSMK